MDETPLAAGATGRARLEALVRQRYGTTAGGQPAAAELVTNPIWITIDGVSYQMQLFAFHLFGKDAPSADVPLQLTRQDGVGLQQHAYDFEKDGVADFQSPKGSVSTAKISFGTSFRPTRIESTFTASQAPASTRCTTFDGSKGTLLQADGTISSSEFKLATGTSPFFGDITTPPLTATMYLDPGCAGTRGHLVCPPEGAQELQAGDRRTEWEVASDGTSLEEVAFTAGRRVVHAVDSYPAPGVRSHRERLAGRGRGDHPLRWQPVHGGHRSVPLGQGARHVRAVPLPLGRSHPSLHVTEYTGTMSPKQKPFLALFDTGYLPLADFPAVLDEFVLTD